MRSAVLANAQSRIAFRLPTEDARTIAADSALDPEDFQNLGAFECYAQLVASAAVQPWCSAAACRPASRSPIRRWCGQPRGDLRRGSGGSRPTCKRSFPAPSHGRR